MRLPELSQIMTVVILSTAIGLAVSGSTQYDPQTEEIVSQIRSRTLSSVRAVYLAGDSRNIAFVPHLKQLLSHRDGPPYGRRPVDLALAKLGDAEALQRYSCYVDNGRPSVQQQVVSELKDIGGWFAFRVYARVLNYARDQRWLLRAKEELRERVSDSQSIGLSPPSTLAIQGICELRPEISQSPGCRAVRDGIAHRSEIDSWKRWITRNQKLLSKLEPVGKGVDFGGLRCKEGAYVEATSQTNEEYPKRFE